MIILMRFNKGLYLRWLLYTSWKYEKFPNVSDTSTISYIFWFINGVSASCFGCLTHYAKFFSDLPFPLIINFSATLILSFYSFIWYFNCCSASFLGYILSYCAKLFTELRLPLVSSVISCNFFMMPSLKSYQPGIWCWHLPSTQIISLLYQYMLIGRKHLNPTQ